MPAIIDEQMKNAIDNPPRVSGVPRKNVAERLMICVGPDGGTVLLSLSNARDWARRGGGHKIVGDYVPAKEKTVVEVETDDGVQAEGHETQENTAQIAVSELHKLRDEASLLGIEWKPIWGKRRLGEEIAKIRDKVTADE